MITLEIDTSNNKVTKLVLQLGDKKYESIKKYDTPKADAVLREIDILFKKTNTDKSKIDKIIVHRGPGSYTGIRVGLAIANTLAFALRIPVNNRPPGEYETALYK